MRLVGPPKNHMNAKEIIESVKHEHCGSSIDPQWGRSRRCEKGDGQCSDCRVREGEAIIEALSRELDRRDEEEPSDEATEAMEIGLQILRETPGYWDHRARPNAVVRGDPTLKPSIQPDHDSQGRSL